MTDVALQFLLLLVAAPGDPPLAAPTTIHVFVALADNATQGIVPVPHRLGNGNDPAGNLYWGAKYGVKTWFGRASEWTPVPAGKNPSPEVLERAVFRHRTRQAFLVADAYRGASMRQAIVDFLTAAAGAGGATLELPAGKGVISVPVGGGASLVAYVGHDGLMEFEVTTPPATADGKGRDAIVLACASNQYFASPLRAAGARPVLWTTGLMAPEAYVLEAAVAGWLAGEAGEQVRDRAAAAYDKHQKCGLAAAQRLFVTGW